MKRTYLTLIIMLLVIGFAAVATNLMISGKINIGFNENDFEVYFSKATLDGEQSNNLISSDGKSIKFTSKVLTDLGDVSTLVYEVTNNSKQYDAQVKVNCTPTDSEYINLNNSMDDTLIEAQSEETGTLTATLKTLTTEEHEETITCTLEVSAVSRTSVEGQKVEDTYSIGAYLYDKDDNVLSNKYLVIYSNTPHYVETDNEGYFYVEGLERGLHEIYYMAETNPNELTKEEVKTQSIDEATVTTETKKIEFEKGEVKTDKESIGKEKDIIKVSVEIGDKVYSKVVEENSAEFEIDKSSYTTILCNQKVELDENDKIEISEVAQDTECKLYTSIVDAINDHNTNNNIGTMMMLNDETLNQSLAISKELFFNLNGNTLTCLKTSESWASFINNTANATYYDLKHNGKIISESMDVIGTSTKNITINSSINIDAQRSAVRLYSHANNSIINVNGGTLSCHVQGNSDGCAQTSNETEIINIKNAEIESEYTGIRNKGIINLENTNITANDIAIDNYYQISIKNGQYISKNNYTLCNYGISNIKGENATLDENNNYISGTFFESYGNDHTVIMQYEGELNIYNGTIFHPYVGNGTWRQHALRCEGGTTYIYGGHFNTLGYIDNEEPRLTYQTIYLNKNSIVNIIDGIIENNIEVNYNPEVSNPECIVNICGGTIKGWVNSFKKEGSTSLVKYRSSGIIWDNETGNIHLFSDSPNVILDDSITCGVN